MATQIKFGTDGWRGIIADDYTFDNVRRVGNAIAHYVHKNEDATKGLVVGYDTRFGSRAFAEAISEVLAAAGIAGSPLRRLHAHSGAVVCGEESRRGRRRDDHVQPQSVQLEWREVQGGLRRLAHSGDHASRSRRSWTRPRIERPGGSVSAQPTSRRPTSRRSRSSSISNAIKKAGFKFAIDACTARDAAC